MQKPADWMAFAIALTIFMSGVVYFSITPRPPTAVDCEVVSFKGGLRKDCD